MISNVVSGGTMVTTDVFSGAYYLLPQGREPILAFLYLGRTGGASETAQRESTLGLQEAAIQKLLYPTQEHPVGLETPSIL